MSPEDRLRSLRPRLPAEGLRARVLSAARSARREQRLWRWTWAVASAVLAVSIPLNAMLDGTEPPSRVVPPAPFGETADEGLRRRWQSAVTPRPGPIVRTVMQ